MRDKRGLGKTLVTEVTFITHKHLTAGGTNSEDGDSFYERTTTYTNGNGKIYNSVTPKVTGRHFYSRIFLEEYRLCESKIEISLGGGGGGESRNFSKFTISLDNFLKIPAHFSDVE